MKYLIYILLFISLPVSGRVFCYFVGPYQKSFSGYENYFVTRYRAKVIYSGLNIDAFGNSYRKLINSLHSQDTIIQVWHGHTGKTYRAERGGACFILPDKIDSTIDYNNDLVGFNAIGQMCQVITGMGIRLVIILDSCYAGLLVNSLHKNSLLTVLMSVSGEQECFMSDAYNGGLFSYLLLNHTGCNSKVLVSLINREYLNKSYYNMQVPVYRKSPETYYPLMAVHYGNPFNFK